MRRHIFLLASIAVLTFMALTTEKKVLITTGYAITEEELALGRTVYQHSCRNCHERGVNGAPSIGSSKAWEMHIAGGMAQLLQKGAPECLSNMHQGGRDDGGRELSHQEIDAAIAFMINRSRQ